MSDPGTGSKAVGLARAGDPANSLPAPSQRGRSAPARSASPTDEVPAQPPRASWWQRLGMLMGFHPRINR